MTAVPLIDLADQRGVDHVARAIDRACRHTGFLLVTGHGADADTIAAGWAATRAFFDRPLAEKMTAAMPYPGYPYGYSPVKGETLAASLGAARPADLKETFSFGPSEFRRLDHRPADDAEAFVFSANPWPLGGDDFRRAVRAYYREMSALARRIMRFFARGLGLPDEHFERFVDAEASALRLLNYPDLAEEPAPGQLRAGEHSDYGSLTILMQEDAPGGLEVLGSDGAWHAVPAVADTFVINIGDLMQRWTNDAWRSTLHRVAVPPKSATGATRRQSIAFFHQPNWDAEIACIETCLASGALPKYAPVGSGAYLAAKFRSTVAKA
ncbi:isopenicillin N synthase family dioxygenase [Prosthecomicrobium pneumaticum]|uniref:2-oxoglutarate-dependent ethylene/succinate-forming enzyme n=1 Tax=Prosthecomicrobium pneumaticum TaxID=81895 RepID=A0A7W9FP21_9HYPH|nr:isopenicillin N synthase family oxygenase [Prosthecomicrobium pneumaticum]MBB5754187.1 isopenicillin N synthase-like dioxygenase [Prosthecomicrobium pneumaticum]